MVWLRASWEVRGHRTLMPIVLETHGQKLNMSVTDKVSFGPIGLYTGA